MLPQPSHRERGQLQRPSLISKGKVEMDRGRLHLSRPRALKKEREEKEVGTVAAGLLPLGRTTITLPVSP